MNKWIAYLCFLLGTNALSNSIILSVVKGRVNAGLKDCEDHVIPKLIGVCNELRGGISELRDWTEILGPAGVALLVAGVVFFVIHKWRS